VVGLLGGKDRWDAVDRFEKKEVNPVSGGELQLLMEGLGCSRGLSGEQGNEALVAAHERETPWVAKIDGELQRFGDEQPAAS
jgi:hypothetical protein